jgi:Lar family restriction alleviation protein
MSDTPDLLPCPFCACNPRLVWGRLARGGCIDCPGCGATGPEVPPARFRTREEAEALAIERWNRRANLDRFRSTADRLGELQRQHLVSEAQAEACKAVKP